jgi:hypothetical protein
MQHPARPMSIDHRYTALYATADGETHLRTVDVQLEPSDFAPPAQPLLLGEPQPAGTCFFLAFPCGWGSPTWRTDIVIQPPGACSARCYAGTS